MANQRPPSALRRFFFFFFVIYQQVFEDLRAVKLSLDDVAEFTGTLDDNVDDVGY